MKVRLGRPLRCAFGIGLFIAACVPALAQVNPLWSTAKVKTTFRTCPRPKSLSF